MGFYSVSLKSDARGLEEGFDLARWWSPKLERGN